MSKTNTIKRKTTGFDIVYRVITAVMAVAMFPLAYFSKLLFVVVMHEEVSSLLQLFGETNDPGGTYFEWSIADFFDSSSTIRTLLNFGDGEGLSLSAIWGNEYLRAVLFAVIFFVITLVIAVVILGFAIFSNKAKIVTWLSGTGFLTMIASFISFNSFFANPIVSGAASLRDVFAINGTFANLALAFVDITSIKLEGAFFYVMFLMLGIFIWAGAVLFVNASDEKEKAEKAMERANKK